MPRPLLHRLFANLQDRLAAELRGGRELGHAGAHGRLSEGAWLRLLGTILPNRYSVRRGFVVDSEGRQSDEIDLILHDAQYTPLLFEAEGNTFVPAESVYAVFEVKQALNAEHMAYAADKAATVRRLHRTSAAIPHAGGVFPPQRPKEILAGLLVSRSDWSPVFGQPFTKALAATSGFGQIDLGCVVEEGAFSRRREGDGTIDLETADGENALVFFFLALLQHLQRLGTVTAIDYQVYKTAAVGGSSRP